MSILPAPQRANATAPAVKPRRRLTSGKRFPSPAAAAHDLLPVIVFPVRPSMLARKISASMGPSAGSIGLNPNLARARVFTALLPTS
jgi:hypothetical protein